MNEHRLIELIATKYLLATIGITIAAVSASVTFILIWIPTALPTFGTIADLLFKIVAIVVGTVWTLNRYYVGRTDAPQIRVDADVHLIPSNRFENNTTKSALLIFRLDVVNTGKTLIPEFNQFIEIASVSPSETGVQYEDLYRWPSNGLHPGGIIEPGSWSAINGETPIPEDVNAVRIYIELQLSDHIMSTWHKTFDVSKEKLHS